MQVGSFSESGEDVGPCSLKQRSGYLTKRKFCFDRTHLRIKASTAGEMLLFLSSPSSESGKNAASSSPSSRVASGSGLSR